MHSFANRSRHQVSDLGHSASDNDRTRVDKVDQTGNSDSHKGARSFDNFLGGQVTPASRFGYIPGCDGGRIYFREQGPFAGSDQLLGLGSDSMSTGKRFEATMIPTCTERTVLIDREMPDLSCRAGR